MTRDHLFRSVDDPRATSCARPRSGLALVIGLFVLLAGIYSIIVPAFETPDEIWHFAFIQHLAAKHALPVSAPNTQALWRQQGVQAPGYYLAAAGLTFWVDQSDFPQIYERANPHAAIGRPDAVANRNYLIHHADEGWPWRGSILALHLVRFLSVALGAVTLWATYRTLVLLVGAGWALLGTAVFGFIPQFIFISAAASNDNAINALAALVLWRLVALVTGGSLPEDRSVLLNHGLSPSAARRADLSLAGTGCLLGLALLSKLSALALVALTGLALLIVAWRAPGGRQRLTQFVRMGLAVGLPAVAISGWWYIRNWVLYHDLLAWNVWRANILLRMDEAGWRTIVSELTSLEHSFWGLFGWLNLSYPAWVYSVFRALEIGLVLGLLIFAGRWLAGRTRRRPALDARGAGAALLILWLALLGVSWIRFMRIAPAAQGRYFFPAAPAIALLAILGLQGLGRLRLPRAAGWIIAAGLALLSAATPFWIIGPGYRPPAPETGATAPVRAELGGRFAILGVAASPGELAPGDAATVTVIWEALAPDANDYSVFVHLESDDGLIIAQADTMPGDGLLPTSAWTPGQTRGERYIVTIPATAYTPDRGRWAVGLYDHRTGARLPLRLISATPQLDAAVEADGLRFGAAAVSAAAGDIPNRIQVDFQDNVTLGGYSFSSRRLTAGAPMTVTLYWRARGPVTGDYTAFAHLLDSAYAMYGGHDGAPQPQSSAWQPGQIVTDTHTFTIAADAAPGFYQVEIGLYTWPDLDRLHLVQSAGAEGANWLLLGPVRVDGAN